jgi:hypothetical protein
MTVPKERLFRFVMVFDIRRRLNSELGAEFDQRGKRVRFHLSHNVCAVDLYGVFGYPQLKSGLLV